MAVPGRHPPASAFFFWMDRQSYWAGMEPEAVTFEIMLVGTWAAAAIVGAAAGLLWERRKTGTAERDVRPCIST